MNKATDKEVAENMTGVAASLRKLAVAYSIARREELADALIEASAIVAAAAKKVGADEKE